MADPPQKLTLGARVAVAALTALADLGGWLVLVMGGFHHMPHKRAGYTVFVDGPGAWVMAGLSFLLAAIGAVALLKDLGYSVAARGAAVGLIMLSPVVYALAVH